MLENRWENLKPGVRDVWLYLLAGLVWLGAGLLLISFASRWFTLAPFTTSIWLIIAGLILAAGIYSFGFSKLAKKNIQRINSIAGEKICLFAFQEWTSYPLVAFMMSLGIYLRVYSPFPKLLLAAMYLGIGGALSSASLHYFGQVIHRQR
ncbi:MAG TPA: hypothetical protein VLM80_12230 [Anaerolineales bacterium]|nr:hypothetical protein [Anaerolineales bacterium]